MALYYAKHSVGCKINAFLCADLLKKCRNAPLREDINAFILRVVTASKFK